MKRVLIAVVLLVSFASCSRQNEEEIPVSKAEINIGTDLYLLTGPLAANENCDYLFVTVMQTKSNYFPYYLELMLSKKGDIIKAHLTDQTSRNYKTSPFNPADAFHISSFAYDPLSRSLSFHFDGTVFDPYAAASVTLNGHFQHIDLAPTVCSSILSGFEAELESDKGKKERFYASTASGASDSKSFRQFFYSNNGYRIVLENNAGFQTLPRGSHEINSDSSSSLKITFQKYLGLSDKKYFNLYNQKEWKEFKVVGKIEIGQTLALNGLKGVTGQLNFTAFSDTNEPVYQLKNGNFTIVFSGD